jgi:hypothetical protein
MIDVIQVLSLCFHSFFPLLFVFQSLNILNLLKGNCRRCDQKMVQKCYCGKVTEMRICGSETKIDLSDPNDPRYFSCGNRCDRFVPVPVLVLVLVLLHL